MEAIDADAHVIETAQTWSYLEEDERIAPATVRKILEINPRNFYGLK